MVFNIQMLEECKSTFKLNYFNRERYAVSCLNSKNEYIIQLFDVNLKRDFNKYGKILFRDDDNARFDYDIVQGKENELVMLRADLSKNKYFLEAFNFIKNAKNLYELCPDGCQDCYFLKQLGILYQNNSYIEDITLNCSLCKFNRYFADDYADLCFLKKNKTRGYEYMCNYHKFSSCEYCCKTGKKDDICDTCLNINNYEYFIDEANNGRCEQKCYKDYGFIRYDNKICTSSCNETSNCKSFDSYIKDIN